jgi:hypothetical protein
VQKQNSYNYAELRSLKNLCLKGLPGNTTGKVILIKGVAGVLNEIWNQNKAVDISRLFHSESFRTWLWKTQTSRQAEGDL